MAAADDDRVRTRIRRGFALFNERDWDALERGFPDDFEAIDNVPPDVLRAAGPGALREMTDANGDTAFAGLRMEAVEIELLRRSPQRVLAVVRVAASASGGSSAIPVAGEIAQLWTFEDGVAIRLEQFRTWADAQLVAERS